MEAIIDHWETLGSLGQIKIDVLVHVAYFIPCPLSTP